MNKASFPRFAHPMSFGIVVVGVQWSHEGKQMQHKAHF
jgi:hypothetical protein